MTGPGFPGRLGRAIRAGCRRDAPTAFMYDARRSGWRAKRSGCGRPLDGPLSGGGWPTRNGQKPQCFRGLRGSGANLMRNRTSPPLEISGHNRICVAVEWWDKELR